MTSEIDVSRLNEAFSLTASERKEFAEFIKVLEGVMERHGRDTTTEQVVKYLRALLDRERL